MFFFRVSIYNTSGSWCTTTVPYVINSQTIETKWKNMEEEIAERHKSYFSEIRARLGPWVRISVTNLRFFSRGYSTPPVLTVVV